MKKIKWKKMIVYLLVGIIVSTTVSGNYLEARTVEAADPVTLSAAALVAIGLLGSAGIVYTGLLDNNSYEWSSDKSTFEQGAENLASVFKYFWDTSAYDYAEEEDYDIEDNTVTNLDNKPPNWDDLVEKLKNKKQINLVGNGFFFVLGDALDRMFKTIGLNDSESFTDEQIPITIDLSEYGYSFKFNTYIGHKCYAPEYTNFFNKYKSYYDRICISWKSDTYAGFSSSSTGEYDISMYINGSGRLVFANYTASSPSYQFSQASIKTNGNYSNSLLNDPSKNGGSLNEYMSSTYGQITEMTFKPGANLYFKDSIGNYHLLFANSVYSPEGYGKSDYVNGAIVNNVLTVPDNEDMNYFMNQLDIFSGNQFYTQGVLNQFIDYLNEPLPEPEPEPDPEPEPEPDPEPGTGVDPGAGTDPGGNSGQTPGGADVDNDSFTANLSELFPFCIPFDLVRCFKLFNAEPVTPRLEVPLHFDIVDVDYTFVLDLEEFNGVAELCRAMFLILYIVALILATRGLIRG